MLEKDSDIKDMFFLLASLLSDTSPKWKKFPSGEKTRNKVRLHPPKVCPFCGAKLSGGGTFTAYYDCGAHIWIENFAGNAFVIRGHTGICYDKPIRITKIRRTK
jgi:hypothetical protein